MCLANVPKAKFTKGKKVFLVSPTVAPQTIEVLKTRASGFGIELRVAKSNESLEEEVEELGEAGLMGAMVQYPDVNGEVGQWEGVTKKVKGTGAKMVVASDLLALTMLKPPGEWGADIVCGNSQRFGELPPRDHPVEADDQVCRSVMVDPTRLSSRVPTSSRGRCLDVSSGSVRVPGANQRTVWHCRVSQFRLA